MAVRPNVEPIWQEATFQSEGLDARALITRTDLKGIITFASLAYRKMTKYPKPELLGKPHSVVRHPFMPEVAFKGMWEIIKKGEHWEGMVMNLRKDGKHYWVIVPIEPIDQKGDFESDPQKIVQYVAVRKEPDRKQVKETFELYKQMRLEELKLKTHLKDWEQKLLKKLTSLKFEDISV